MGNKPGAKIGAGELRGFKVVDTDEPLLEHLPAPFKEILVLSKGMTLGAIVIALNVAPGTVKSRLNRARNALLALRIKAEAQP